MDGADFLNGSVHSGCPQSRNAAPETEGVVFMKKSFAVFAAIALAFFPAVSCVSGQRPAEPGYGDEPAEKPEPAVRRPDPGYRQHRAAPGGLPAELPALPERPEPVFGDVPESVKNAVRNAPANAVVGIGAARMLTRPVSRNAAIINARSDVSRQLEIIAMDMIVSYLAAGQTDSEPAQTFLDGNPVTWIVPGSAVVYEFAADDGYYWVVVLLSRDNLARTMELNAAGLVPGAGAAMWYAGRVDAALQRNNSALWARILID